MKLYLLRRLVVAICLSGIILFLPGCAGAEVKAYTDPAKIVEVSTKGEFSVTLESNPTTGYLWQASYDENLLKLVDKTYRQNDTRTPLVGVGGTDAFIFQAIKAGSTEITFNYKRPRESEIARQMIFKVTVK